MIKVLVSLENKMYVVRDQQGNTLEAPNGYTYRLLTYDSNEVQENELEFLIKEELSFLDKIKIVKLY